MKAINIIALLSLVALNGFAVDYSTMTMTELQAMRGSVSEAERTPYQAEMQIRVQAMTLEERQAFQESMKQNRVKAEEKTSTQTKTKTQSRTQMQLQTQLQTQLQAQQRLQTQTRIPSVTAH